MIRYPYGAASTKALTATGDQAITIDNTLTIIDGVTVQATGARNLVLTISEWIKTGARILLKTKTAAVENTTFGAGITGVTYAGVAGKTKNVEFIYDGATFQQTGAPLQID